jgi:hypothetical protein
LQYLNQLFRLHLSLDFPEKLQLIEQRFYHKLNLLALNRNLV